MTVHVITAATWEYVTPAGKRRRAFFGDAVELTDDEAERGFKVGAIGVDPPVADESAVIEGEGEPETEAVIEGEGEPEDANEPTGQPDPAGDRPARIATKDVLVDWLSARGFDRAELDAQTKDELWALIDATD
ncbi:hypothetical protein [[Mycobacterium] crassicus]|uniref:Uncharacterized protein n=1 Tax=[Mycobacterium] crassicus TaxID=2872309 RepID=A0ABU5XG88_9MYCO|nr:hypothetical protein [Mycolicibacter sp. MYC098]MEB3021307.1 hypothetical protein [Mycolicibacter sp. MYC098]